MDIKRGFIYLALVLFFSNTTLAHVCNDVVSGSQVGCPDPQTVTYISQSSSDSRFTIVSDITAKHIKWVQASGGCNCVDGTEDCYDNADFGNKCNAGACFTSGFTVQSFTKTISQGDSSKITLSSSPSTSYALLDKETKRFNIYIDVDPSAPSQHFQIRIGMQGSLSGTIRPIYDLSFDWEAQSSGCTSDLQCSSPTPYCNTGTGICVACTQPSHCDDSNDCTTDSCNSNTCSNTNVANGNTCNSGSGHCCSGTCDTTLGNTNYDSLCRSGPACNGNSWEYSIANTGTVCSGTCRQCNLGLCSYDNSSRCSSGFICSSGTCSSSGCTSDSNCTSPTLYCNLTTGSCVQCLLSTHCDDSNDCTTDSCISNSCSNQAISGCGGGGDDGGGGGGGDDGGGGGGGGGDPNPSQQTYIPTQAQLISGYSKTLSEGNRIKLNISTDEHLVTVEEIYDAYIKISINSTPITAFMIIGEIKKFDLTEDRWYDLQIKLENITDKKADLKLNTINEIVPQITTDTNCSKLWSCGNWSSCQNGKKTRICTDINNCTSSDEPAPTEEICGTAVISIWLSIGSAILVIAVLSIIVYFFLRRRKAKLQEPSYAQVQ